VVVCYTDSANILKYIRHENGPAAGPAAAAHSQMSDASIEWLDDDDEELVSSEHLDSVDSNVSWPKRPKLR